MAGYIRPSSGFGARGVGATGAGVAGGEALDAADGLREAPVAGRVGLGALGVIEAAGARGRATKGADDAGAEAAGDVDSASLGEIVGATASAGRAAGGTVSAAVVAAAGSVVGRACQSATPTPASASTVMPTPKSNPGEAPRRAGPPKSVCVNDDVDVAGTAAGGEEPAPLRGPEGAPESRATRSSERWASGGANNASASASSATD